MYKIIIKYDIAEALKNKYSPYKTKILISTKKELRSIVTLLPESDYEIESVNKISQEEIQTLAKDFIAKLIKQNKPKDIVYGVDEKKLKKNYKKELDKKSKKEKK